jgi:hypothetical protein
MRTPNCQCLICKKPLYRRPLELKKVRYVACIEHRAEAQKISGITEKQLAGLSLGREKGTNHLIGIHKSEESKRKRSASISKWCAEHPDEVAARGKQNQGESHYRWNGGSSRLNTSIRTMTENRKWMGAVKERDGECKICNTTENLESHHIISLAILIEAHGIKNRDDARKCKELWDLNNGPTLCQEHHYKLHGRNYEDRRKDIRGVAA